MRAAADAGLVRLAPRHRVDALTVSDGVVAGVRGTVLEPDDAPRGAPSSRVPAVAQAAQQESRVTSVEKDWAAILIPSAMVR